MTLLVLKKCEILQLCIFVEGFPPLLHEKNENFITCLRQCQPNYLFIWSTPCFGDDHNVLELNTMLSVESMFLTLSSYVRHISRMLAKHIKYIGLLHAQIMSFLCHLKNDGGSRLGVDSIP